MEDIKSFVFYETYYDALRYMGDNDRLVAYNALMEYVFFGVVPCDLPPMVALWFDMAKPTVDSSLKRHKIAKENGSNGGRPSKSKNQTETKKKPKQNLNNNKDKNKDVDIVSPALQRGETYRSRFDENGELIELEF
jgi:phage-related protein